MTLPYLPAIDGLRALAVLAVLAFHLDPAFLPGGFAGVDVFFVISGYVVARSLAGREGERVGAFLAGFYARRVRRILPALVVCLLLTSLFTVWLVPESWLSSTTHRVGLAAFFGLSNLALVLHQDDYFSPRTDFNPFTHTWSLGVEEQFYFIFPLLFLIWLHWRCHQQGRWIARALLPGLALVSLGVAYLWGQQRPDWAYYLLPARFWELALGVLLFQWQQGGLRLPPAMQRIILPLGLMLIAAGYLWSDPQAFPYPWALLPVSGSLLVLWGISQGGSGWVLQALQQPVLRYVGLLSYSLYLWHWPVYVLLRWTLGLETWGHHLVNQINGRVTASHAFTQGVLKQLHQENQLRFVVVPEQRPHGGQQDPVNQLLDQAAYSVPEVIRLSTGRERQPDGRITQDLHFASVLAHRLVRIPWARLPVERDPQACLADWLEETSLDFKDDPRPF